MTGLSQQLKEASSKLKVNRNTVHWVDVNCPALDCVPPSPTSLPLPPFPTSLLSLLFFPSPLLPPLPCLLHPSLPSFLTQERSSKLHQTTTTLQAVQSECATYKNMAEGYQEEYERATAKLNVGSPLFVSPHSPTPSKPWLISGSPQAGWSLGGAWEQSLPNATYCHSQVAAPGGASTLLHLTDSRCFTVHNSRG